MKRTKPVTRSAGKGKAKVGSNRVFIAVAFVLAMLFVAFGITGFSTGWFGCNKKVAAVAPPASTNADYVTLLQMGKSLVLLQSAPSYAAEGKFVKDYQVTVKVDGWVDSGYLYVRARAGSQPLDGKYDSVYIILQDSGGHLMQLQSLLVPNSIAGTTEMLFPLSAIPAVPHVPYNANATNFQVTDWVELLNSKEKVRFWIAISTLNTAAVIDEVKIVYSCVSWDCQLSK
jgi:hypothetical protein